MPGKLKLAILSIHSSPLGSLGAKDTGGMSTYLLGITEALGAAGHPVDIYTRAEAGSKGKIIAVSSNVRLISIADGLGQLNKYELSKHAHSLSKAIEAYRQQHKLHYNLIFSHYWVSGLVGQRLQSKWQLPHLLMFHTLGRAKNELCPGENEPPERLKAEEKLASTADLLIVAARSERERLLNYYRLDPDRVRVIQAGIDRHLFRPLDRSASRQKIGFKSENIILAVGRLEPVKGFELLLSAAALIDRALDYRVVIIGGDDQGRDYETELKDMTRRLCLTDRVFFAGRAAHQDLPYYYNAASVTVIPSCYESFGLIALESLACNTPVMAGPVGVIPELAAVPGSESHLVLITEREPAIWASKLEHLLTAPPPLTGAITDQMLTPFNWPVAAGHLADLSNGLLENKL